MRSVELFAGAGGLALGVGRAGFVPVGVIEWNRSCCDTLRSNQRRGFAEVAGWPVLEADVRALDYAQFGQVDLVTGGPPCQPFSIGGKHRAHDDARDMFPEAVRAVRQLRPKAFMFENVKGLTRGTFANYFEYIRLQLSCPDLSRAPDEGWEDHRARLERHFTHGADKGLAYNVVTRVLNAADYGVPQRRERVFFVGFREDLAIDWNFPAPTHSQDALLREQFVTGEYWDRHRILRRDGSHDPALAARRLDTFDSVSLLPWRTVRDAIRDLPDPSASNSVPNHRFQTGARAYIGHTGSALDEPAKTLKAGDHGVPGGENMLRRSDGSVRYFTVRESARLQTFPDGWWFDGAWTEAMRQLGNAVPVDLAHAVAREVAKMLSGGRHVAGRPL